MLPYDGVPGHFQRLLYDLFGDLWFASGMHLRNQASHPSGKGPQQGYGLPVDALPDSLLDQLGQRLPGIYARRLSIVGGTLVPGDETGGLRMTEHVRDVLLIDLEHSGSQRGAFIEAFRCSLYGAALERLL